MGDLEGQLSDKIDDARAAEAVRPRRTPPPDGPEVRWNQGKTIEVDGLILQPGQAADRALLAFLDDVMGEDAGVVDALDLSKLSFSLLYSYEDGRRLAWIKCPVDPDKIRPADVREAAAEFVAEVGRRRPRVKPKPKAGYTTDDVWVVSDTQLGKGPQAFGGLAATRDRLRWWTDERLPQVTGNAKTIYLLLLGDLTEGCQGSYDNQQFTSVLNTREQFYAAEKAVSALVERALDLAENVVITGVASNHDQNSRGSGRKNVTDHWDDRTFMLMDALNLAFDLNPERFHDRVSVLYPEDPLVTGLRIRGTVFAGTHGHEIGGGKEAVVKVNDWWKDQIASRRGAAAAATVLIGAHHHNYYLRRDGGRLLVGTPAADGGSKYLLDAKGIWSMPGMVSMSVDDFGVKDPLLHTWPEDRRRAAELGVTVP